MMKVFFFLFFQNNGRTGVFLFQIVLVHLHPGGVGRRRLPAAVLNHQQWDPPLFPQELLHSVAQRLPHPRSVHLTPDVHFCFITNIQPHSSRNTYCSHVSDMLKFWLFHTYGQTQINDSKRHFTGSQDHSSNQLLRLWVAKFATRWHQSPSLAKSHLAMPTHTEVCCEITQILKKKM